MTYHVLEIKPKILYWVADMYENGQISCKIYDIENMLYITVLSFLRDYGRGRVIFTGYVCIYVCL